MSSLSLAGHLRRSTALSLLACALIPSAGVLSAAAQERTIASTTVLDTIVVSGERTDRPLAEVYQGVTIIPGDAPKLQNAGITLNSLVEGTPNAFVQGPSELPSIRGVQGGGAGGLNSAAITGAPSRLPIIVDGVNRIPSLVNRSFTSLWDARQVEILRGPQSLLRGRTGIAGAMVIETNEPTSERESAFQTGVAMDAINGPTFTLNTMLNGALTETINGRLTAEVTKGQDPRQVVGGTADFLSEVEQLRLRGKLAGIIDLGSATTRWSLLGEHDRGRVPQTRNFVEDPALTGRPYKDRAVRANAPIRAFDTRATALALKTETELGNGVLETVSSYAEDHFASQREQTFASRLKGDEKLFSQDVIYKFGPQSDLAKGDFGGLAAFAYEHRKQNFAATGVPLRVGIDVKAHTVAGYTDLRYGLTDQITLNAGARLQNFSDRRAITTTVLFPPPSPAVRGANTSSTNELMLLPSIGIGYRLDDVHSLGASLRRGYTPGGAAINAFSGRAYEYASESVWTGELTWRARLQDDRVQIGATAFYNDFDNPQVYGEVVPGNRLSLQVFNQKAGQSYGAEFDARWQVFDSLRLDGTFGLLRTEITRTAASTPKVKGNHFGQDPSITASLGFVWEPLENWQIDGRATFVGSAFNDFNNAPGSKVGNYTLVDLGTSYKIGQMEVRGSVSNLLDEAAVTRYVAGAGADITAPRTFSLTLTTRF